MHPLDPIPDDFIVVTPKEPLEERKVTFMQKFLTWMIRDLQKASKEN